MASAKLSQRAVNYGLGIVLVLMLLYLAFGDWGLVRYRRLSEDHRVIEERTQALQRDNEVLRDRIYRLRKDDRYLEKVAREEFGLAREGEIIYRFPPADAGKPAAGKPARRGSD